MLPTSEFFVDVNKKFAQRVEIHPNITIEWEFTRKNAKKSDRKMQKALFGGKMVAWGENGTPFSPHFAKTTY